MLSSLDCLPCFIRQALELAKRSTADVFLQEQILRRALGMAATMDFRRPPPVFGQGLHRHLLQLTGEKDPYRAAKEQFNAMALAMLPEFAEHVRRADDPFQLAVQLAIVGNIIDMGIHPGITEADVRRSMEQALGEPVTGDIEALRNEVAGAKSILYLADNAGEIVFDRLLLELLPLNRVTLAVRGSPVLNDATRIDARTAGLDKIVEVIDNGSDAPGTVLSDCTRDFRRRFAQADLVISKGQGNFETLDNEQANIFFLFKVKCPVVSRYVGLPVGTQAVVRSKTWQFHEGSRTPTSTFS